MSLIPVASERRESQNTWLHSSFSAITKNSKRGFRNKEVKCEHYQERGKTGFYSLFDYIARIVDIFTLYFNTRFTKKPLQFFSALGGMFLLLGVVITIYVFVEKIFSGYPIGDRPVPLLAILFRCSAFKRQASVFWVKSSPSRMVVEQNTTTLKRNLINIPMTQNGTQTPDNGCSESSF